MNPLSYPQLVRIISEGDEGIVAGVEMDRQRRTTVCQEFKASWGPHS